MQFKPLEFEDKELIEKYLPKNLPAEHMSCEMCFNTLYIWRKSLNTEYAVMGDCLILKSKTKYGEFYRVYGETLETVFEIEENPNFFGLTKPFADKLLTLRPDYMSAPVRQFFEYVYEIESLIKLSGKKYHSKKNHFNAFLRENPDYAYKPMDSALARECAEIYPAWFAQHPMKDDEYFKFEGDSLLEILLEFDKFNVNGGVLYAQNGEICAFTVSEQLTSTTALIHFEKAAADVRGAFTAINKLHLEHAYAGLEYVNREDDAGIEGLKKAKESYKPCFMVEKYRVGRNSNENK